MTTTKTAASTYETRQPGDPWLELCKEIFPERLEIFEFIENTDRRCNIVSGANYAADQANARNRRGRQA